MVKSKCDLCIKQSICTIHSKTCDREFEVFEKERLKEHDAEIRADERENVLEDVHKAMANKYHCKEDMCEVGMTCADCLKEYMEDLYSDK